jgi:RNA 2',3'-cyclic 3'-phosphodiesterase
VRGDAPQIRSFLAIEIGGDARPAVRDLLLRLRDTGADVAWTRPEHIHLTLKFLGGVAPERLEALGARLRSAVAGHPAFGLAVAGLGAFPSLGRPRVLWVGAAGPGLSDLATAVEDGCAEEGFVRAARAFHPHVTLGRLRAGPSRGRRRVVSQSTPAARALAAVCQVYVATRFGESPVESVTLFRSDLGPGGARHTVLAELPLAGAAAR